MSTTSFRPGLLVLAGAAVLGGCGPEPTPLTEAEPEALAYGDRVDEATQRSLGLVRVNGCSGALLRPDWVITARHCLGDPASGTSVTVASGSGGTLTRVADRHELPPAHAAWAGDVGLVHLSGAPPAGWPSADRPLESREVPAMLGVELSCYGLGPGAITDGRWVDGGVWRRGTFAIDHAPAWAELDVVSYQRNAARQIIGPGDSGGPCFTAGPTPLHAGNTKAVGYGVDPEGRIIDTPDMRGYATATAPYAPWIQETLARPNHPRMDLRGTMNGWATTPMTLSPGRVWEVSLSLAAGLTYSYKFDASGCWAAGEHWGDGNADGVADGGGNIRLVASVSGAYRFELDDQSLRYRVTPPGAVTTLRVHRDVGYGHRITLRGSVSPLSWSVGQGARWTAGNVWVWETSAIPAGTSFELKPMIDDVRWSVGGNLRATAGQVVDLYPSF